MYRAHIGGFERVLRGVSCFAIGPYTVSIRSDLEGLGLGCCHALQQQSARGLYWGLYTTTKRQLSNF